MIKIKIPLEIFLNLNEFHHQADRAELLQFVDPRNSRYAIQEAATLFGLADTNKDKKLTIDEMLNKQDLFMTSKFISLIENFHNEF